MSVTLTHVLMASAKTEIMRTRVSVILDGLETTAILVRNKSLKLILF